MKAISAFAAPVYGEALNFKFSFFCGSLTMVTLVGITGVYYLGARSSCQISATRLNISSTSARPSNNSH